MVFDPCPENALIIVGADFFLTVTGNTLSQEGGDIVRLYIFMHKIYGEFRLSF